MIKNSGELQKVSCVSVAIFVISWNFGAKRPDALRQFLDSTEIQDSTFHRFCKEKLIIYYYADFAIKNACRMFIYNTT